MNKQNKQTVKEITKQDLPLLVQAKSSDLQQKYLTAYNQAISKGLSSSEAEFSAYNQLRIAEKQLRPVKTLIWITSLLQNISKARSICFQSTIYLSTINNC